MIFLTPAALLGFQVCSVFHSLCTPIIDAWSWLLDGHIDQILCLYMLNNKKSQQIYIFKLACHNLLLTFFIWSNAMLMIFLCQILCDKLLPVLNETHHWHYFLPTNNGLSLGIYCQNIVDPALLLLFTRFVCSFFLSFFIFFIFYFLFLSLKGKYNNLLRVML